MCKIFELSRSKYYEYLKQPVIEKKKKDEILESKIPIIHNKSKQRYGSPKMHNDLKKYEERVFRKRVEEL
jgi:putative transposase